MAGERVEASRPRRVPRWLVAFVVVVTAGATAWAMSMTNLRGPQVSWVAAREAVEEIWGAEASPQFAQPGTQPGLVPVSPAPGNALHPVAGGTLIPPIQAGATALHADRGACTSCHSVLSPQGVPVASIRSQSNMPHAYRGVCTNCHQVTLVSSTAARPVAGTAAPQRPQPMTGPAAPRQPAEAEWQGLEVGPAANGGVEVSAAEAAARVAGVQRGDVVSSINGSPVTSMVDFIQVTQKGRLSHGTLIISRSGQRLAFELGTPAPASPTRPVGAPGFPSPAATPEARF